MSDCLQDTWSRVDSLPKQQNANDLMSQNIEASNILVVLCIMLKQSYVHYRGPKMWAHFYLV